MTREQLKQAYVIRKELRMWQERRNELELDIAPLVKNIDGMPYSNTNSVNSPTEEKAIRLNEAAAAIDEKIKELKKVIKEIEDFIFTVEDSYIRQILEYRCVYCMKWKDVASKLGEGYTEDMVKQSYHRFVKEL